MFRLLKFTFKLVFRLKLLIFAFGAGMSAAFALTLRELYGSWGLLDGGGERGLPGDDLVPKADVVETRAVEIDAPPAQVWPWLVQLGYGRGGWYGYGALDRPWSPAGGAPVHSADTILEEFQELAVGDLVPIHDDGGFAVRHLEPGEALVLYLDDAMAREQLTESMADAPDEVADALAEMDMPPYTVSWAFLLEDAPGGRTKLIERLRFRIDALSGGQRRAMPLLGMAAFTLMRSQMLGIKRRAEAAREG